MKFKYPETRDGRGCVVPLPLKEKLFFRLYDLVGKTWIPTRSRIEVHQIARHLGVLLVDLEPWIADGTLRVFRDRHGSRFSTREFVESAIKKKMPLPGDDR